ncbi:hypothetical protein OOZ15_15605 [Galbibacter sp. EGI 63066]|uniref:hypothetical protein n=1 Tax=Galbibacter sp. EGI 63066 TaxID=2993559 RepID=UPI0022491C46|nr:hypothetical protein [Galbibacter sp. EGI 63066]MCX2681379.1 hypothetical protein [Galbibacter sp. EGI 63066]
MKFVYFTILFFFAAINIYGQGDIPKTPIPLEGLNSTEKETDKDTSATPLEIKTVPDLNNSNIPNPAPTASDLANKEVNMFEEEEQFLDPGERFEKKLNRKRNKGRDTEQMGATTTQYFGDFVSKAKSIKILCRDHEYVDGDRVSVIINDKVVVPNIYLESRFKGFFIELEKGFNKIEFRALNQGTSGPNTAQFAVFDDQGVEISSDYWNLSTGVKASLLIIKEEEE